MSTSNTYPVRGQRAAHVIAGSFGYDGTNIVNPLGEGASVTREGVGKFTVTFDKTFPEALSAVVTYGTETTAGSSLVAQVYSKVHGSLQIRLFDMGAALALSDPQTGDDCRISFMVYTRDSLA